jgi:hypothetical protein
VSTLSIKLKQRARVLAAGVVLSASTFAILPGVAEATVIDDGSGSGDQSIVQSAEQNFGDQQQTSLQVSAGNVAANAPVTASVGGPASTGDNTAFAGNYSNQEQNQEGTQVQIAKQEESGSSYEPNPCNPCEVSAA